MRRSVSHQPTPLAFSNSFGRRVLRSPRWHLAPDNAFATMPGTGTNSFVSNEQGGPGSTLAREGGTKHGRPEAAAQAGRSRPRGPRHGADRLHDARLDDRHHRRSRDHRAATATQAPDPRARAEAARAAR